MSKRSIRRLWCATSAAFLPSAAFAQPAAQQKPGIAEAPTTDDTPAAAETPTAAEEGGIADIVVTATRSETRLQDTPLSITALSGDTLQERQITNVSSLAEGVPSMQVGSSSGMVRVAIRGIGLDSSASGAEGRVAYHLDGVYISRPRAIGTTFFDVDRVEVLRGPQGTLYGRNATGGAVNVITNKPNFQLGGYVRVGVGNYDTIRTEGAVNVPLSSKVAVRLAEQSVDQNKGFGKNTFLKTDIDDEHSRSFRAQLLAEPTSSLTINFSADYARIRDHSLQDAYGGPSNPALVPLGPRLGGTVATDPRDINGDAASLNRQEHWGASLTFLWDLGGVDLTSVSGYRHNKFYFQRDQDTTELPVGILVARELSHQWSQELRLNGRFSRGKWIVGAFAFREKNDGNAGISPLLFGSSAANAILINGAFFGGKQDTDAYAAFGQVDFDLTAALTVTAGARYSYEKKRVDEFSQAAATAPYDAPLAVLAQVQSESWSDFSPRLSVEFRPAEDKLLYATYSKGFKSGGYGVGSRLPAFDPETLANYEVGLKADWLDRRLRTNLSLFYYDYKNLQLQQSSPTSTGVLVVLNAKGATIKGAEAELIYSPVPDLEFAVIGSILDTKYDELFVDNPRTSAVDPTNLEGKHLTQAPNYTVNASAQRKVRTSVGDFTVRGEFIRVGRNYFSPFNFKDVFTQPAYSKINGFLNYESAPQRVTASLWVRNLTNKTTKATSVGSGALFGAPVLSLFDPPRTLGLDVGYRF